MKIFKLKVVMPLILRRSNVKFSFPSPPTLPMLLPFLSLSLFATEASLYWCWLLLVAAVFRDFPIITSHLILQHTKSVLLVIFVKAKHWTFELSTSASPSDCPQNIIDIEKDKRKASKLEEEKAFLLNGRVSHIKRGGRENCGFINKAFRTMRLSSL